MFAFVGAALLGLPLDTMEGGYSHAMQMDIIGNISLYEHFDGCSYGTGMCVDWCGKSFMDKYPWIQKWCAPPRVAALYDTLDSLHVTGLEPGGSGYLHADPARAPMWL